MDILRVVSENQLYTGLVLLVVGACIGVAFEKIRGKHIGLKYNVTINRIGVSTDDPIFGNIRVLHNNLQLRNLYQINVEIRNDTSRDISDLEIKAYTGDPNMLLNERSQIRGTPFGPKWSDEFVKSIHVEAGEAATDKQFSIYRRTREYCLPTFKRFSTIEISYMCTNPTSDDLPNLWLDSPTKGVSAKRVKHYLFSNGMVFGVPFAKTFPFGLIFSISIICAFSWLGCSGLPILIVCFLLGMCITLFGAIAYRCYDFLRKGLLK